MQPAVASMAVSQIFAIWTGHMAWGSSSILTDYSVHHQLAFTYSSTWAARWICFTRYPECAFCLSICRGFFSLNASQQNSHMRNSWMPALWGRTNVWSLLGRSQGVRLFSYSRKKRLGHMQVSPHEARKFSIYPSQTSISNFCQKLWTSKPPWLQVLFSMSPPPTPHTHTNTHLSEWGDVCQPFQPSGTRKCVHDFISGAVPVQQLLSQWVITPLPH